MVQFLCLTVYIHSATDLHKVLQRVFEMSNALQQSSIVSDGKNYTVASSVLTIVVVIVTETDP